MIRRGTLDLYNSLYAVRKGPDWKVFRMLLAKEKITREWIAMLSSWRHSGFHVFCGNRISPNDETAMKNLARYIIYPDF